MVPLNQPTVSQPSVLGIIADISLRAATWRLIKGLVGNLTIRGNIFAISHTAHLQRFSVVARTPHQYDLVEPPPISTTKRRPPFGHGMRHQDKSGPLHGLQ